MQPTDKIIIEGMSLENFLIQVEQRSYLGMKRAIEEDRNYSQAIDWNKYSDLMTVKDVCSVFPVKEESARIWIKDKQKFGEFSETGKLLFVSKKSVRKYYEQSLNKSKR